MTEPTAATPSPLSSGGQAPPPAQTEGGPSLGGGAAPAKQPPPPVGQTSGVVPTPQPTTIERTPTRKLLTAEDDALPDDADSYEISKAAFKKRLERYGRQQLRQQFGTDNVEEVLAWKKQAQEAAQREEQQRLAQMTEAERYKAQYEKANQQAAHWRQQYEQLQEQHEIAKQDQQVMGIAARHVDPDCVEFVSTALARHLAEVDESAYADGADKYIDAWVRQYVSDHPKFGITLTAQPANGLVGAQNGAPTNLSQAGGQQPPRQISVPFSNGAAPQRSGQQAPNISAQKTAAPGQANSMSDSEWKEFKRANGYNF